MKKIKILVCVAEKNIKLLGGDYKYVLYPENGLLPINQITAVEQLLSKIDVDTCIMTTSVYIVEAMLKKYDCDKFYLILSDGMNDISVDDDNSAVWQLFAQPMRDLNILH